jgi:hypothetical protein
MRDCIAGEESNDKKVKMMRRNDAEVPMSWCLERPKETPAALMGAENGGAKTWK